MAWRTRIKNKLRIKNPNARIFLAELLGTFLLMVFGQASVAQWKLGKSQLGEYWSVTVGYGFAVMVGVAASIGVSGGHINPAVTASMALLGRIKLVTVPFYMMGQYLGSFLAAVVVFCVYYDAMTQYDPGRTVSGPTATAGIFTTFPQPEVSTFNTFIDQIVGTALLLIGVLGLTDPRNTGPPKYQIPLYVGLLVVLIGNTFGYNCGYPINPARDLAPRLFTWMAGWGAETFSFRHHWFWVPVVGPHAGAIIGAMLYQILVGVHWPDQPETGNGNNETKPEMTWTADVSSDPKHDEISQV